MDRERKEEKRLLNKIANALRKAHKASLTEDSFNKIFDYLHEQVELLNHTKDKIN